MNKKLKRDVDVVPLVGSLADHVQSNCVEFSVRLMVNQWSTEEEKNSPRLKTWRRSDENRYQSAQHNWIERGCQNRDTEDDTSVLGAMLSGARDISH